jgi:protein-S-isoprenylcysteine O-methyltransferase Ste14
MDALAKRSWNGVAGFAVAFAAIIFLPAWTLRFWQGWAYWLVFNAGIVWITAYFLRHDRALVERRITAGPTAEHEPVQKRIQTVTSVMLILLYLAAGFDHRFRWSPAIDARLEAAADALVAMSFYVFFLVFRQNSFAASIIQVVEDQRVISTGLYGIVRHPMYAGAVVLFLATPLALGSWWAYLPAAGLLAALVTRILDEERYLVMHLSGYEEYRRRVRWRLVPGIW